MARRRYENEGDATNHLAAQRDGRRDGQAHEGGLELTVSPSELAAGEQVTVGGEGFTPNATVGLSLTGPGGDVDLGEAATDEDGDFDQKVTIPATVVPGLYLIVTQGGPEASVELSVTAMPGMATTGEDPAAERDRGATWKIGAIVALLVVAALGAVLAAPRGRSLVRRPAA